MTVVVIGTRGSPLALAQTRIVVDMLKKKYQNENLEIIIKTIKTEGDEMYPRPQLAHTNKKNNQTGKDLFTGLIDGALIKGEIDAGVHSLKDVPVEGFKSSRIEIAALPKRESPYDVLITRRRGGTLANLPHGARVGTSSVRRAVQLKSIRPDLRIMEIHGNVQTRIRKLKSENLDAIILAEAGLKRLGLSSEIRRKSRLSKNAMLPAVGQGCLAVTVRKSDARTKNIMSSIDHEETRAAVTAERSFSKELGGGCNLPIAALATFSRSDLGKLILEGMVDSSGSSQEQFRDHHTLIVRSKITGSADRSEELGRELAIRMKGLM